MRGLLKLRAFTLIEMMVTMSLFSISMLAILSILSSAVNLIQKFYEDDSSRLQSDIFLTRLDLMSRKAIRVDSPSPRSWTFYYRNGTHDELELSQKKVEMISYDTKRKKMKKIYFFNNARNIEIHWLRSSPPQALQVSLFFQRGVLKRSFLLGYQKQKEIR